ncbi:MAG: glycoside-pentoside-hexuronide (GPH):cation symporter [Desulfobacterales bacterium]|jgi:GPH family glycoside/pentoside/hexuronide:cation symporter|nr:glycoside-pentoside-hexuronide (GPH):cation symporter [Desulfobacterales bacterium]
MKKLNWTQRTAYAAPAFALAVVGIPVYVYIPKFYTDVIGVHVSAMGLILLIVRLFDAVTDPAIGLISDRIQTPFGRRRPFIAVGALLTGAAVLLLFNPPHVDADAATVWFMVLIFLLFLFWTVIIVPYESLGPELTFDYNERTTLFGMRDGALIAGTLVAAASPAAIKALVSLPEGGQGERDTFFILSVIYVPLIFASAFWCVWTFKERAVKLTVQRDNIVKQLSSSLRNRPFRILLISYTISAIGNNLPATLILYYVEYVLHSTRADLYLVLYFVTGVLFLPLWVTGAKRYEKKLMWLLSMAVNTGAFSGVFFLGPGDELAYGILVFISGIGFGATLAIPSAIQADVIDYDELISGQRREGLYIGLWSIAKKMAAAFGVGVGLALLGVSGYVPNVKQPDSVVFSLRVLYALVPCICNAVAIVIAFAYPISGSIHKNIRDAITLRSAGEPVFDPLDSSQVLK